MSLGFAHPSYARSLREFGEPLALPRSGGTLLSRSIGASDRRDAMGPYPIFCCQDWEAVRADLQSLVGSLISVTLVADPFGPSGELLESTFSRVTPFKSHYVADLRRPLNEIVKPSHRETVRRAQRRVEVEVASSPANLLDSWMELYDVLVARHQITGVRAFSRRAFAEQLEIPGMTAFVARAAGEIVGMDLWFAQDDVVQGHLAACNETGYELRAMYAMKWAVLEHFKDRATWINFGGGAGTVAGSDGLSQFKAGWSTETRMAFLCGEVLNPELYEELARERGTLESTYFPAYRTGEFA